MIIIGEVLVFVVEIYEDSDCENLILVLQDDVGVASQNSMKMHPIIRKVELSIGDYFLAYEFIYDSSPVLSRIQDLVILD